MAKKKTRVLLPGGIQGLVHDLQNGTSHFKPQAIVADATVETDETEDETPETVQSASSVGMVNEDRPQFGESVDGQRSRVGDGQNQPAIAVETATKGRMFRRTLQLYGRMPLISVLQHRTPGQKRRWIPSQQLQIPNPKTWMPDPKRQCIPHLKRLLPDPKPRTRSPPAARCSPSA